MVRKDRLRSDQQAKDCVQISGSSAARPGTHPNLQLQLQLPLQASEDTQLLPKHGVHYEEGRH